MHLKDQFLEKALEKRKLENSHRSLSTSNQLVDFSSNDYLGLACKFKLRDHIELFNSIDNQFIIGSTGSRLLRGNHSYFEELENKIAQFHKAEAGLIFNSGYNANIGLFSSVPQREDTIIYDELVHASIRDGIRLSLAKPYSFKHNDLNDLESKLKIAKGTVFIAIESVYSMDGDFSPIVEIVKLCEQHNSYLIVDEAHATGIFGEKGEGRVVELGLQEKVFSRVHTFGKALGCHGAIVLGGKVLRDYLINFSRAFIYTTALPFFNLITINYAYDILSKSNYKLFKTSKLINLFKDIVKDKAISSNSPIQCVVIPGNAEVKKLANEIQNSGFDVRAILSPTVQKGKERLRICIHAFNTEDEVKSLSNILLKNL